MNGSSYGGSDSESWLLSLFQSLMLSLVLWQPLTLYVVTWIKIWMFTWHLEMLFPKNCPALIRRCCCGPTKADRLSEQLDNMEMVPQSSASPGVPEISNSADI